MLLMMKMMVPSSSSNKWRLAISQERFTRKKRFEIIRVCKAKANMSMQNSSKKANLSGAKRERIQLPKSEDGYRISEFFSHPSGIQSMLNIRALENFESIDDNTYRCFLPKLQLLNFEAAPVLDLRVVPTQEDCTVEMLCCKFQGSEILERQNEHFSAFVMNRVTWNTTDSEPFLEADVKLNITLEIYTAPFTLLPTSAVEGPGNFNYCKVMTSGKIYKRKNVPWIFIVMIAYIFRAFVLLSVIGESIRNQND